MLVQHRDHVLRCVMQHDHGLATGELARHWRAPGHEPALDVVLAAALHDIGWEPFDAQWRLDHATQAPTQFTAVGSQDRLEIYDRCIRQVAACSPYAGMLVSVHFASFVSDDTPAYAAFVEAQAVVRRQLAERVPFNVCQLHHDYDLVRVLDLISLYAALTQPGTDSATHPTWLRPAFRTAGRDYSLTWQSEETLRVSPNPFDGPFAMVMPYRELPRIVYADQTALTGAVARGTTGVLEIKVV